MTDVVLNPNDKVVIKYDCGEYYADYPSQVILGASKGSIGRIVSIEEFKTDFIKRLGRQQLSQDQKQAYIAHFSVVQQAMAYGLQYPILFEKIERPTDATDLVLGRQKSIELIDGAAIEKAGSGGGLSQVSALFGKAAPKSVPPGKIVWPATKGIHDQAKFTDFELAIIMSNPKPATWEDIEFVYLRYISTVPYHNLWFRLKEVVAEAAFDIIDTLRFRKHNHAGYSWEVISEMVEKNDPRRSLWYTDDQHEALVVAAQKVYQMENERGRR
jgi:hypothetical protein